MVPLYTEREHHPNLFLALEPNAGMSYPSMSGMRVPSTVLKRVAPYIYSTPLILFNCIMFHIEHDGHASMLWIAESSSRTTVRPPTWVIGLCVNYIIGVTGIVFL